MLGKTAFARSIGPWLIAFCPLSGDAQQAAPPSQPAEVASHDTPATFNEKVNLVLVPVIIRDSSGHAVGGLRKEDFLLFDKGKPQVITRFSVETPGSVKAASTDIGGAAKSPNPLDTPGEKPEAVLPEHYVAYLFDDVHLDFADLARAREAATKQIGSALGPGDRAAIYSTSGQTMQDFTGDRAKLFAALVALKPRPVSRTPGMRECPDVDYYMADLIQNKNDPLAVQLAAADALACMGLDPSMTAAAQSAVMAAASRVLSAGQAESRIALIVLKDVVRRLSAMPGQRTIVFVSPGFLLPDLRQDEMDVMDRALRANIAISSVDARGLFTIDTLGDIGTPGGPTTGSPLRGQYVMASALAQEDVMAEMADGTGGTFFHNNNDLAEGFRRVATAPEYIYLLGFSPQNLKLDGSYHVLKVSLAQKAKTTVQARRGYFAPKHAEDPAEQAKQEISEALFSREVMRDIPIELHTQFFKPAEDSAKLAVLAKVDVRQLRFNKVEGRNRDDLTVVAGLFDRDGNFVTGQSKTVEMRLLDDTLARRLNSGITVKSSFDVKPGGYFVRLVVRDTNGQVLAAENGSVEIP